MGIFNASASELRRKGAHYTVLPNHVLKTINNADALAIWTYLQSQSEGFLVRPTHIQNHLDIGEIRYTKAMTFLRKMGLVSVQQQRNEQGHITGNYIDCYSEPTEPPENPESGKNQDSENPDSGETPPLIKNQGSNQESKDQSHAAVAALPVCEQSRKPSVPIDALVDLYNTELGDRLPRALKMTDERRKGLTARWREMLNSTAPDGTPRYVDQASGLAWWAKFFRKVKLNPHWMGSNDRGWTPDLTWIVNPTNFTKILEYKKPRQDQ